MRNREEVIKVLKYNNSIYASSLRVLIIAHDRCSGKQHAGDKMSVRPERVVVSNRIHSCHVPSVSHDSWIVSEH